MEKITITFLVIAFMGVQTFIGNTKRKGPKASSTINYDGTNGVRTPKPPAAP